MPVAMNVFFTAVIVLLAAGLSLWSGSPVRADQVWLVLTIAIGTIVVIWVYPKAGV